MSKHAFLIIGGRVVQVANPCGAGLQYRAHAITLAPEAMLPIGSHESAATVMVVTSGIVEVMVNGATWPATFGEFIRVPARAQFACRNIGTGSATLLVRTEPERQERSARRVVIEIAA